MKIGRHLIQPELALFTFVISISRILTIAAFPTPSVQPDSGSYSAEASFDFSLVSFTGDSVRSWPTPLLFSVMPSSTLKMVALIFISVVSWIYLASVIITPQLNRVRRALLLTVFAIFATNPSLIQWETVLLGQSLMISNVLCLIATLVLLSRNPGSKRIIVIAIIFANLLYLQKSSNLVFAALSLFAIILLIWSSTSSRTKIATLGLTIGLLGYSTFVSVNVDKYWGDITYSGKTILWHLGGQSPDALAFKNYLETNTESPKCVYESAPFSDIDKGISGIVIGCSEAYSYLSNDIQIDFAKFLIQNPINFVKLQAIGFGASFSDSSSHYGKAVGILPPFAYSFVSGSVSPDFRFSNLDNQIQAFNLIENGEPLWIFAPGLLWIFLAFGAYFYRRKLRDSYKDQDLFFLITFGLLVQSLITFTILPSEWVRASAPFVPLSVLASLVCLICHQPKSIRN